MVSLPKLKRSDVTLVEATNGSRVCGPQPSSTNSGTLRTPGENFRGIVVRDPDGSPRVLADQPFDRTLEGPERCQRRRQLHGNADLPDVSPPQPETSGPRIVVDDEVPDEPSPVHRQAT
jgi:hypothetical protein